eukprot:11086695-Ditylum_brightwellii.AAC.1
MIQDNNNISYHYLCINPTNLPRYLKEFCEEDNTTVGVSRRNVQIVDVPSLLICIWPGNGTHLFIEDEDSYVYASCKCCFCCTWIVEVKSINRDGKKEMCLKCCSEEALLWFGVEDADRLADIQKL